jgi:hypothetical protein
MAVESREPPIMWTDAEPHEWIARTIPRRLQADVDHHAGRRTGESLSSLPSSVFAEPNGRIG